MDVDGGHRAFGGGHDCELGVRSNVARGVDSVNARLLCFIYPHEPALLIQSTSKWFMKVSREFGPEIEEERVAFKRLTLREDNALQLPRSLIALQRNDCFCSYCDIKAG